MKSFSGSEDHVLLWNVPFPAYVSAVATDTRFTQALVGTTSNGSPIVTGINSTSNLQVGLVVTGSGIPTTPNDTTIISIDSATQITLSVPATAGASPTLTFALYSYTWAEYTWDASSGAYIESNGGRAGSASLQPAFEVNNQKLNLITPCYVRMSFRVAVNGENTFEFLAPVAFAEALPGEKVNLQTGTTYTYVDGDRGKLVSHTNAAAIAGTLPQAGASSKFIADWWMDVESRGSGALTITPTVSTIDGAISLKLGTNQGCRIVSDGVNYYTERGKPSCPDTTVAGYDAAAQQLLGHDASGVCQFYNVTPCGAPPVTAVTGDETTIHSTGGTTPQLSIVIGGVGTTQLANSGVTTAKIADGAVSIGKMQSLPAAAINQANSLMNQ